MLLGAAWAAFFWGGYYIAKKAVAHGSQAKPAEVAERASQTGQNKEAHHH
jgi:hypothetical protein